ncbi:MAG: helix-turn-helix domain-containing protein [Nocardioidaceae bacterium]|nr:helix-turn-helix domain-containing protein [Nocardioidaceae bacterium]
MSTTQAADQLGVTDRAVRLACQLGRLAARQVGGRWQVSRAVLDEYQRGKGGT